MSDYYEFIFDLQRFDDEPTEGDDNINNSISGATINALGGNDTIENSGDSVSIYGGVGADSIYNESGNATINGGTGNNTIVNDGGYGVLFQYGGGSDVIEGFDVASSDIQISSGSITSAYFDGSDAVLNIGNGSIRIKDFPKDENLIYVKDGAGNVEEFYIPMTITGTEQSETFDKDFNNVTIQALGGNDTVENSGANVLIDAGDGNDSIRNSGSNVTINVGDGRDEIYNDSSKVTIDGDADNDSIDNRNDSVSISGGNGNDTIYNQGASSTLDGGAGNDYIDNNNSFVSIGGGEGADSILNSGSYVTIDAGEGNDSIDNGGASSTIYGGAGADSILNSNNNVVIYGGDDNDSIRNESSAVSINGGAGNDSIYNNNYGENVLINGNAGDDYISNAAINVLIVAGEGNNSVDNTARNVTVETGAGNDTINNSSDNLLVRYGGGSDIIDGFNSTSTLQTSSSIINALSNGNDVFLTIDNNTVTLKNYGNSNRVNIKYGDDEATELQLTMIIQGTDLSETIRNENDAATIQAYAGHDTVDNYGGAVSIDAGAGNDSIRNNNNNSNPLNSNVTIDAGDGADFIYNNGASALINGGADDDTVENYGAATSIIGGGGRDSVYNESSSVMIDGGEDGDIINNAGSTTSISAGAGNDSIRNTNSNVTIDSGAGADSIDNRSESVTIDGGEGTDSIANRGNNVSINGGAGVDSIFNYSGNNVTIDTGEDDDIVYNEISNVLIIATQGSNSINSNSGDNVTIRTGAGNDTVRNNGDNFLIQYGGGSDIINGFNSSSTLQILTDNTIDSVISDGTNSTLTIGDNNLVLNNVGIGSSLNVQYGENSDVETFAIPNVITVNSGYYSNSISNVTISGTDSGDTVRNEGANSYINLGEGADSVYNVAVSVSIEAGAGDDTVNNNGSNSYIILSEGDDTVNNNGSNSYINLGDGADSIYNLASRVTIDAGAGDDTVYNSNPYSSNSYINLGDGADSIYNSGSWVTIDAGTGIDSITISEFYHYSSINGGADDDLISIRSDNNTIVGGTGDDTIYISGSSNIFQYAEGDGNDYIELSTSSSTLQITSGTVDSASTNGKDLFLTVGQNTISLVNGIRYSTNIVDAEGNAISLGSFTNLNGTSGDDSIRNYISNATINALGGNDTIYNYASYVRIQYTGGNDLIHSETSYSTVQIAAGTVDTITTNGRDFFLTVGQNTVTVENYFNYSTSIIDVNGNAISFDEVKTINGTNGNDSIQNYINYATINALGGDDTVYNTSGGDHSYINLGEGADSIYSADEDYSTIDGGAGSDSINGRYWRSSISGGAGDDLISIYSGDNDNTIIGGTGNDTIYNNSGNLIQYAQGDGNDYISNFTSNSTLQITSGTVDNVTTDKTNIFVAVGNGTITLANAARLTNLNIFNPDGSLAKLEYLIEGTEGDDSIENSVYSAAINALGGNDTIRNNAYYVSINAGAGDDTVYNNSGGDHSYINLGDGNDSIYSEDEDYSTIDGSAGADSINGYFYYSSINGGADDDLINIYSGDDDNTIVGGTGNDTIYNNSGYNLFKYALGDGNDIIYGFTSNSTLHVVSGTVSAVTTDGTNTFVAIGNNTITIAEFSNVSLNIEEEDKVYIEGTDGNDSIRNYKDNITINSGAGNDSIYNEGSAVSISSGAGADSIYNEGSEVSISSGEGNDSIYNEGSEVSISSGAGNDFIFGEIIGSLATGSDNTIDTDAGDDTVSNDGANASISTGTGNDSILNYGASAIINSGDGNDSILNQSNDYDYGINVSINAGADNDYIYNNGASSIIDGGAGDDFISISRGGNYNTINGGTGNDTIYNTNNSYNLFQYAAGDGNDIIYGFTSSSTLQITSGSVDAATSNGTDILLAIGESTITLESAAGLESLNIFNEDGSQVEISSYESEIYNSNDEVSVDGTEDDDYIENDGSNVTINAGDGNDYVYNNNGYGVIIDAGAGNDSIYNEGYNATNSTIEGGTGSDSISGYFWSSSILGGADDDLISISNNENTISGGTGDDTIYISGSSNIFQYAEGDGNDYISGFDSSSTLQITSGTVNTVTTDGTNIFVAIGESTISLAGFADVDALNIIEVDKMPSVIEGTDEDDSILVTINASTVKGYGGNDTIIGMGDEISIDGGTGEDLISNYEGEYVTINGEDGADSIVGMGDFTKLNGDSGNDTIMNSGDFSSIDGGAGDDVLYNSGASSVIDGGDGEDLIGNTSSFVTVNAGADDDYVINEGGSGVYISASSGNNYIDNTGENVTIDTGDGNDTINSMSQNVSIDAGAGNNAIYISDDDNTLYLGDGNNTITVGENVTTMTIRDFGSGDVIILPEAVDSVEEVNNVGVIAGNATIRGLNTTAEEMRWTFNDNVATYAQNRFVNLILSEDGKSIVQGSGRNSTIIGEPVVTIGGVASTDGFDVDFDNNVITISESALNRSDITASAGFTFKFEDIERNDSRQDWLIDGTTATFVNITTVEKYYLEEDNSQIIYDTNSEMEPVVTVNGVVSTEGLSISGDTVTVKLSALSQNATVTISDGYYLALGEDVPRIQNYDYAGWRLNGNTATYIDGMTEEGYVLENNRISYTMTGDGEVLVTVSGVKNTAGLALDAENKIVTVEQSALNQSNVTISDGYTLAFTDIETATTQSARWTFDNNTATYINTTSKEIYTLEDNQIVYRTISTEDILVTVEGVTSTDGLAIDTVNKVVTVSTDSLSQDSMVTVSNGYTLALDSNITPAQIQNTDWNMRGSNAYGTIFFGTAGYLLANNQIRYATTDKTENVVVFNVASTDGLSFDGTTVTVSKASLNKNTVRISGGYTLKLGNDVDIPYRAEEDWSYDSDNSNAIYTSSTRTEGYQLVNNQIMYVAEKPGEDVTISGLANSEGINLDGDTFIIPESALSQHNTATILNEGYKLSLAEGVTKSARSLEGWKLQDGTAIYTTDSTTAGYKLANNKITYEDEIIADTLVAVEGVTSRNGLEIDKENKIVAVYGEALNGNDIAISGDYDYKLQLADSNRAVKDNSGWLKENNKFSYQAGVLSDGYKLSDSGKNLTYIAEEKGNIAAVLDGVRKAPTFKPVEEAEPTVIQITEDNFADDELSILSNGGEYQFEISGDFNAGKQFSGSEISDTVTNSSDITIDLGAGGDSLVNSASGISISGGAGNDKIYNSGSAVSILGGKGNDNVTVSGDNSDHNIFLYHMDSGKDKLINLGRTDSIKIADSVAPEVTTNISGNDIIFNIGGGAIKIKDGLTSNVAINMIDSENNPVDAISGNNYTTEGVIKNDTIKLKSDLEKEYKADNVSTVDGSQLEEGISINAGLEGTSILGGVGRDTLLSGSKDFTFKGGNGNDVFVYNGEVNGRIEDYSISGKPGKDKVSIDWDKLKEYNIITGNLELTFEGETEDKTLTIDKVNNTNITFLLNGTTKTKVSSFNDDAIFSSKSKLAEIGHNPNSKRNNAVFDGTQYSKVVTIDASEANYEVNIIGNKKANLITAGSDGSTINGKKGKDTLVGGAESDIFVYEKNSGNKVIRNYEYDASGGDVVSLQGGVKITAINDDNKGNRILSVGKNKITLEGGASLEAFKFDDGTEKIAKDGMLINLVDGKETSISLTTSFSTDSIDLSGKDWINLDASEFNKGLTITGNTQANSLIGSKGNNTIHGGSGNNFINGGAGDDELWGEDGANTFIFNPGNGTDTIKDFNASLDKILIQDTNGRAVNFKGKYNSSKDTLTLTVNGGGKVILTGLAENLEDGQSVEDLTFNINGSHKISGKKLK